MAVVGLERTFYQVSENVGVVEVCAVVRNPTIMCPISFPFAMRFSTADGTAGNIWKKYGVKAIKYGVYFPSQYM